MFAIDAQNGDEFFVGGIVHGSDPDYTSEPGRQFVSTHGSAVDHSGHYLDALQAHPLQVAIVEATVSQQLTNKIQRCEKNTDQLRATQTTFDNFIDKCSPDA